MDRDPHQPLTTQRPLPLTPEEAKARLRAAAQNVTLAAVVSRSAWPLLAVAVAGGFIAARLRLPKLLGSVVIQRAAPLLLGALLGRKGPHSGCCSHPSESSSLKSK